MSIPDYISHYQRDKYNRMVFIKELTRISKVSEQYADAAWFTLESRKFPIIQARNYKKRWL
jgi:hypothetical protein